MGRISDYVVGRLNGLFWRVAANPVLRALEIETYIHRRLEFIRTQQPENPVLCGFKVFSQVDEDGIIEAIAEKLPMAARNKAFIEIGCGKGIENNTAYLILKGYKGVWVDGSSKNIQYILSALEPAANGKQLLIDESMVSTSNIKDLLSKYTKHIGTNEPEFFSLDIDGNDAFVLTEALKFIRPAVICVEYNGKFPASLNLSIRHNDQHSWDADDYHGATLAHMAEVLQEYRLVSCNVAGTNAFFVRSDCAENFATYALSELYQPARHELVKRSCGHPPSLKWVRDALLIR